VVQLRRTRRARKWTCHRPQHREQSLAQLAIAWVLRKPAVTSALIGASSVEQLEDNLASLNNLKFSDEELDKIEDILRT